VCENDGAFATAASGGSASVTVIELMSRLAVPGLLSASTWLALCPTRIVPKFADEGANAMPGTGSGVPVPLRLIICGEAGALLAMLTEPERLPVVVGKKWIASVQLAPGESVTGVAHPVKPKSPLITIAEMLSAADPLLVMVTNWVALLVLTVCEPKTSAAVERETFETVPVPETPTVCGEPPALLEIWMFPLFTPVAAGANVTESGQDPPAGNVSGRGEQPATWNPPGAVIDERVKLPSPVLLMVTDCGGLNVPTSWLPNASDGTDAENDGAVTTTVAVIAAVLGQAVGLFGTL
jgi:hypothetical protein